MIKDNQKYFNRLHVVLDAFVVVAAYAVAWLIRFKSGIWPEEEGLIGTLDARVYFSALIFIIPGYLILNHLLKKVSYQLYLLIMEHLPQLVLLLTNKNMK